MKTRIMLDRSVILAADWRSCRSRPADAAGLSAIVFSLTQLSLPALMLLLLLLLLLGEPLSQTDVPQDQNTAASIQTGRRNQPFRPPAG